MALYRTLQPVTYFLGGAVVSVRAGRNIELDASQAEALGGAVVYIGFDSLVPDSPVVSVHHYDTFDDFPTTGEEATIYLDEGTGRLYRWNEEFYVLLANNFDDAEIGTLVVETGVEFGDLGDTTVTRLSAGDIAVEGNRIYRAGGTDVPVTDGGTGRSTGGTAYGLIAAGTTATGAQQTVSPGATTELLVGGGTSALPIWTTATGSGAPVRATSPTLVTPTIDGLVLGVTSTVTSGGTLTMTSSSTRTQVFTGTSTHTVKLPSTSVVIGQSYTIVNNSTGLVYVFASASGNQLCSLKSGDVGIFTANATTPTTVNHWVGSVMARVVDFAADELNYGNNLVVDPSFEDSSVLREQWWGAGGGYSTERAHTGQQSIKLVQTPGQYDGFDLLPRSAYEDETPLLSVTAGQVFYGSIWVYPTTSVGTLDFSIYLRDTSGVNSPTNVSFVSPVDGADGHGLLPTPTANTWTRIGGTTVTVPAGYDRAEPYFEFNDDAPGLVVYVDDVRIADVTDIVTTSLAMDNKTLTSPVINTDVTGTAVATAATASTLAKRDSNANLTADNFIATATSTATSGGILTMNIDSTQTQVFTGSTTHTVKLPTTSVVAGQTYTIINQSSGNVTVQSSAGNSIQVLTQNRFGTFVARIGTPTAAADWQILGITASSGPSIYTAAHRDSNANLLADNFIPTQTSTATSASTLTMTIDSTQTQVLTGSTTHTVKLPTTSVVAGQTYNIINQSTGAVTVQSSGANTIATVPGSYTGVFTAETDTPTTAAHWHGSVFAVGKSLITSNSLTLAGTDGTTMTFPTTSATIARTDAANTFTGHQTIEGVTSTGATGTGKFVFDTLPTLQTQCRLSGTNSTFIFNDGTADVGNLATSTTAGNYSDVAAAHDTVLRAGSLGNNVVISARNAAGGIILATGSSDTAKIQISNAGDVTGASVATAATASTLAKRDSNANLTADNFISTTASTVTAAGTTTLDINSAQVQVFTGSTTQTVLLPTTSVTAGMIYTVCNQSTGAITVQSSGANSIVNVRPSTVAQFLALVNTPTAAADWQPFAPYAFGTANTLVQRDSNANIQADAFVPLSDSTVTAAGTTTLTVDSKMVQIFTGSTTQTVNLPTTSVLAGQMYIICDQSTGTITVNSSGSNLLAQVSANTCGFFIANQDTPTSASHWTSFAPSTTTLMNNSLVRRDGSGNILADGYIGIATSTATSGGTLTMDINSSQIEVFTGSTTHTVKLPTTSVTAGSWYAIVNQSSGAVAVQSSGANAITSLAGGTFGIFYAQQATPTTAAHWQGYVYVAGKVLTVNNSITLAGTDGTTMTFPTTSATIARTDAANTFTGHQTIEGVTSTGATGTGKFVFDTSPTLVTPVLGTPSSGDLSSCTAVTTANASKIVQRDSNCNVFADNFISTAQSTVTSGGTLTMDINSEQVQNLTGSSTHTVLLPTTSVTRGQTYTIINGSSGTVDVQSSNTNPITTLAANAIGFFTAKQDVPSTVNHWSGHVVTAGKTLTATSRLTLSGTDGTTMTFPTTSATIARTDAANTFTGVQTMTSPVITTAQLDGTVTGTGVATAATASTLAQRDSNGNLTIDAFILSTSSTITSAGTLTMDINSTQIQIFTGSTTHTVKLPTTSVTAGMSYYVINNSSGNVTVQSSGANTIATVAGGSLCIVYAMVNTPTTAGNWKLLFNA